MNLHRSNTSSPRSAIKRHPAIWMALIFGWILVFSGSAHASHGAAHLNTMRFADWEWHFDSSHTESPVSSAQAKNPFAPYLPGVNRLVLDASGLHCLLTIKLHPEGSGAAGSVCRLFSEPGLKEPLSMPQGWRLFRQELTGGQVRFFETATSSAPAINLNTLTGYLIDTYGVSRLR